MIIDSTCQGVKGLALVNFAINIVSICCTSKSKKIHDCISAYSKAINLHELEHFILEHVISKIKIKQLVSCSSSESERNEKNVIRNDMILF